VNIVKTLAVVCAAALLGSCAKVIVRKVDHTTPADGVIYALPNTVVRMQVKLDRATRSGAPYAAYSGIFAPDGKPVCKDAKCTAEGKIAYSLQPGATFSTYGEPDPANVYLVIFSGGGAIDQSLSMTWNESGLLSTAGSSVTNRTTDLATSGLKLLSSVGTKAALGAVTAQRGAETCPNDAAPADRWVIPILRDRGGDDSVQLMNNYCDLSSAQRNDLPHDPALLEKAVLAYVARLSPLAAARAKILGGTSISMEPATLLTRIESEITQQLTTLYLGSRSAQTWVGLIDVRRIQEGEGLSTAVLRIDPEKGFCITNAGIPPDAQPIPAAFNQFPAESPECKSAPAMTLRFSYYPSADVQLFSKIKDITEGERSFRYRVPAQVVASLSDGRQIIGSGILWIAQLGTVVSLPASRHSKTLSYDLAFIEATGGLKSFKLGSTGGLDTATIDALSSVGGTLADYRNSTKTSNEELAVLTRQDALLKMRDDICTIQKKYGLACTVAPQ
jgi:hypothetical protein